jgi:hypothetical protein
MVAMDETLRYVHANPELLGALETSRTRKEDGA